MKEENELFANDEEDKIKKLIGKNTPILVKEVLREQGRM